MQSDKLIYIVDDETAICDMVCKELAHFGYQTQAFHTGSAAMAALKNKIPDICIIDLGLPDMDGLLLVKELEEAINTGVIILSGRNSLPDRVLGLEIGADDFVSKPFDPRELVARVHSILRRMAKMSPSATENASQTATFDIWTFDPATLELHSNQSNQPESHVLSSAEAELLMLLLKSPKRILSRDQLLSNRENSFDRCIDVRMSRIRKKIEVDPKSPRLIKTVYGAGYMLTSDVSWG